MTIITTTVVVIPVPMEVTEMEGEEDLVTEEVLEMWFRRKRITKQQQYK